MTSVDLTTDTLVDLDLDLDIDAAQAQLAWEDVAYSAATAALAHVAQPSLARFLR